MTTPPRAVVEHEVRLAILGCLDDAPQVVAEVCESLKQPEFRVRHHIKVLGRFGLVARTGGGGEGPQLLVACLDDQPEWVRRAVRGADESEQPDHGST